MLRALKEHIDLFENFATDHLDENNILSADKFLVKIIASKKLSDARH